MTIEPIHQTILNAMHLSILPGWLLLIVAPRWRWTDRIVQSGLYPVGLGLLYTGLLISAIVLRGDGGSVDMSTVEGIATLFGHPLGILTGWAHYLVFDLFVGMWEARDARRRKMAHWKLVPCLVLTLLAGPLGLLLYFALRREWRIEAP
ncbi:MAG: ABA4-like family protein [Litorimonas sp.]